MLRGNLPFDDEDTQVIFDKTQKGIFELNDSHWKKVSELAKDLVKKCLKV